MLSSCYRDLNSGPLPYQGSALPLSYNSKWSGKRDSNPRPPAWKASALSTELFPQEKGMWAVMDSNHRRLRQLSYSQPHLATLVTAHI